MKIYLSLLISFLIYHGLFSQVPSITTFSPVSGQVDTTVIITGTNFNAITADNIVFFGPVRAVVISSTTSSLIVKVPAGATYQPITVTTRGLTAFSAEPFIVTYPGAVPTFNTGSFAPSINYTAGKGPTCIATGDVDGDGKPDLISVNDTSGTLSVFRNQGINGTIAFAARIDYTTGLKPYCVVVGDLDGDGKQDLTVVNGLSNTVSIFKNTSSGPGNISFASKIDLVTGNSPFGATISDLDADGKPDLVAVNTVANTISIFKNNSIPGTIAFSPKADIVTGGSPFWISAGDLDNDGKPDLATANGVATNSVSVLRNTSTTGNISFAAKLDFDGGGYSYSIKIGDIDGDGKPDLTVANGGQPSVYILQNRTNSIGNISFVTQASYHTGYGSFGASLVNLNGDIKADIIVANTNSNTVYVFINKTFTGFPEFDTKKDFVVGARPWVTIGVDLNGDGKTDIATANNGSGNISVLKNKAADFWIQSFSPVSAARGTNITINGTNLIGVTGVSFGGIPAASFTVNSTTNLSAVVDSGASGNVTVWKNGDTAFLPGFTYIPAPVITTFTPTTAGSGDTIIITGSYLTGVSAVSFGGVPALSYNVPNTREIMAVVGAGASGNVLVTTEGGTALSGGFIYNNTPLITSFSPNTAPSGATVTIYGKHFTGTNLVTFGGISAASFTVESPTNITAVVGAGASGNVMVTNSTASAGIIGFTYTPPPSVNSFIPTAAGPLTAVTITGNYFNGTTKVTFGGVPAYSFIVNSNTSISAVVGGGSSGEVKVTATGGVDSLPGFNYLALPAPFINAFSPVSGPVGSVVTISGGNFSIVTANNIVYFGAVKATVLTASATTLTVQAPAGATYQPVSVTTDKNLTAYASQPFIITFPLNVNVFTTSSFAQKTDMASDFVGTVAIHDLDGDGKSDLIVLNGSPGLSIFKNISNGSVPVFGLKTDYEISFTPGKVSVGDLDGDGRPDLLVTLSYGGSNSIWIYRNISSGGNILFNLEVSLNTGANFKGIKMGDFNGDGKPDITLNNPSNTAFTIIRNVSTVGKIVFSASSEFLFYRGLDIATADIDGDKKPDIVISNSDNNTIAIYRNTSSVELFSFAPVIELNAVGYPFSLSLGDLSGDGKTDIALANYTDNVFSIYKNASTPGLISFEAKQNYPTMQSPGDISLGDLDGDAKTDIIIGSSNSSNPNGVISVYKNVSSSGLISFATRVDYITGQYTPNPVIGDLNGDGRPDIVFTNYNTISILKNRIGEVNAVVLCPPLSNTSITSNITGTVYQWQVNTGSGFINISNNSNYAGSATATLQLSNIPSSWAGYNYRCAVDGTNSDVFGLQFADVWTGIVSSAWENAANWSCGNVPDNNTDVVINSGSVIINSNITIRSLIINPGATVTVHTGYKLTILH